MSDVSTEVDCRSCGACCGAYRPGAILISPESLLRWRRAGRLDLLENLAPGHFSEPAFPVGPDGACIYQNRGADRSCTIYELRADSCRSLQVGDPDCRAARRERGLPPLP